MGSAISMSLRRSSGSVKELGVEAATEHSPVALQSHGEEARDVELMIGSPPQGLLLARSKVHLQRGASLAW